MAVLITEDNINTIIYGDFQIDISNKVQLKLILVFRTLSYGLDQG